MTEEAMTVESRQMQSLTGQLQMQTPPIGWSARLTSISAQPPHVMYRKACASRAAGTNRM